MKPRRVLALDCDADALIRLEHALENAGFSTTTTWHVPEALALLEDDSYEVFLLRSHPPQIDAHSILSQYGARSNCAFVTLDSFSNHENILHLLGNCRAPRSSPPASRRTHTAAA